MRKMKRACCQFIGGRKLQGPSSGENASMLPKETQKEREKQKSKGRQRVKNMAVKLLKNLSSVKEETEEKPVDKESGGRQYLSDQAICELIDQAKFLEACNHIYDLEQSEHKSEIKIDLLYKKVAERMWSVVQEAISGSDSMFLEPLKSVGESLKWEKEKEKEWFDRVKDMESVSTWSPKYWNKDLEKLLMECMATQIPSFVSASNTDESALKDHLSQLETTIFPNLRCKRDVFKEAGLLTIYTKCCHACLSSQLSTLTDGDMSFSKCLLIYEWGFNMYRSEKLLMPRWTPRQMLLADAYVLKWNFSNVEEKLLTVIQKEVREALRQVITAGGKPYTDTTIIQVLTGRAQAVQHISDIIKDKVEAVCLGELLHFLHSYKHEVRSLLQLDTFSETDSNLQILENCCIFRAAWHKLTYIYHASADTDAKVKEFIDSTEEQSRELLLQAITSKVKGPRTASLDDPIEGILEFILLTDIEAMKIQLVILLHKFPDIRKEHLNIILDIKGTLSWTDRNAMLEVVYENYVEAERGHNLFFEEIEIKAGKYGACGCCCC
ncbi:uncharacterized protein LOC119857420 isoform X3 [Dermochelys coriacea]|uniref:uncharacterized protein LOC119857420 isoform X3 n=1 Tax=Dermochelys coriacea TaxID=27794 RepID=UPI001CA97447|nr:uncharacterized protein LOC119857420 isoform X3 [Dermochelys coriacea]